MFAKQSCPHCGTHIEFDAVQISNDEFTVCCPTCQGQVTLLRPPPVAAPPFIPKKRRSRSWILGIGVAALALLILVLVAVVNRALDSAIVPEPYSDRYLPPSEPLDPLDRYALELGIKELNRLFYTTNGFFFVNVFREASVRPPNIHEATESYVQGKRVFYKFWPSRLSDADLMNGWEYQGQFEFLVGGSKRLYNPQKDKGWSEWTMFPGDYHTDISLYGTSLMLGIQKKKGGDWEIIQRDNISGHMIRPLSRDKVEELLKLPQMPSVSQ